MAVEICAATMTPFGKHLDRSARSLVEEVVGTALKEAQIEPKDVQAAYVGNAVSGLIDGQESIRGQVVLRGTGVMGIPIVNVENACASSSTALHLGWQSIAAGTNDCVLVVGYEKLYDQDKRKSFRAFNAAMDQAEMESHFGLEAGRDRSVFMDLYAGREDISVDDREALALVSVKSHQNGSLNPYAQYRQPVTIQQVLESRPVAGPLTLLMCSPLSDGAACLVLCSDRFAHAHGKRVRILASVLTSGRGDASEMATAVERACSKAYEIAGVAPADFDVLELHDATASAELHLYEEIGLCKPGDAPRLIRDRITWLGGRSPVNTSGGLISRGHPIGATGAAQIVELVWQLQGKCEERQVPDATIALAQNAGGWVGTDAAACTVHVLQR